MPELQAETVTHGMAVQQRTTVVRLMESRISELHRAGWTITLVKHVDDGVRLYYKKK